MEIKTKTTTYIFRDEATLEDMQNIGIPITEYKAMGYQKILEDCKTLGAFDVEGHVIPEKLTDEIKTKLDSIDGKVMQQSQENMNAWNRKFLKSMLDSPKMNVDKMKMSEYLAIINHPRWKTMVEQYFKFETGESPEQ